MAKKQRGADLQPFAQPFLEWSEIGPSEALQRRWRLELIPGLIARVRLIHRPVAFWRFIRPDRRSQIISEEEARQIAAGTVKCYAINAFDRSDGQIKVLEGSESLFIEFRRCHELTGVELGGADAFDIAVETTHTGRKWRYRLSFDSSKKMPFSESEKQKIRKDALYLPALFRSTFRQE